MAGSLGFGKPEMGSQHPSPNVKKLRKFETQIWLEIITSRDAKSACFKGSQTSCTELISCFFGPKFGRKRSHHVMDACCWWNDSREAESIRSANLRIDPASRESGHLRALLRKGTRMMLLLGEKKRKLKERETSQMQSNQVRPFFKKT